MTPSHPSQNRPAGPCLSLALGVTGLLALGTGCDGGSGEKGSKSANEGAADEEETVSDWPLFRGNAEMHGITPEVLSPPMELAWTREPESDSERDRLPPIEATPVIVDGRVFVGTQGGQFLAFDLETGESLWRFDPEGPVSAPAAATGEQVFFGDTYGVVYALDARTGEEQWRFETDGKIEGGVNFLEESGGGLRLYVGSHDYFLYCLEAESGDLVWKNETANYIVATPAIIDSGGERAICFGGCDGMLHVIPTRGGGESREIEIGSYVANSSAVRDGIAYVAHNGGEVMAIDVATGETVWRKGTGAEYIASPAVDGERLYVGGPDGRLVAYDRVTGEEAWAFRTPRSLDSSPVVSGGVVWQAGMDGRLYAVGREEGKERWTFEVGTQIKASPAVSRGMLVVCGEDGKVYAFREATDSKDSESKTTSSKKP